MRFLKPKLAIALAKKPTFPEDSHSTKTMNIFSSSLSKFFEKRNISAVESFLPLFVEIDIASEIAFESSSAFSFSSSKIVASSLTTTSSSEAVSPT